MKSRLAESFRAARLAAAAPVALATFFLVLVSAGESHAGLTYEQVILADNPTAYWRFEETSTAQPAADSATADGAQNGTYIGPAGLEQGKVGQAVRVVPNLAGADGGYVRANGVNMTASFSVEAWAKSATPLWNAWGWLPNDRGANGFLLHPDNGVATWRGFIVSNAGAFEQLGGQPTATNIQDWHHYAITYDDVAKVGRVYFDGVLVASKTGTTSVRAATSLVNVLMGRDSAGTTADRRGDGWLDEVAVFLSDLTPQKMRQHYSAAFGANVFDGPTSPALDLKGHFVYAVDVGNLSTGTVGKIGDAVFTGHAASGVPRDGATITYGTLLSTWGTKPEYGNTPEANSLETMMHSIVYTPSTNTNGVKVDLDVVPGYTYHLQLLFSENDAFTPPATGRSFDILVEGQNLFDEFSATAMMVPGNPTIGIVFSTIVRPLDNKLNIELLPTSTLFSNHDPILNAFTLELVPEPSTFVILGLGLALCAPATWRRRRRQ